MRKRSRADRARAAQRIGEDGSLRIEELSPTTGASVRALIRWATEGKSGVYLDAVRDHLGQWYSSRAAVERFNAQVVEVRAARAQPAA